MNSPMRMKILAINSGSSSIKYTLFDAQNNLIARGMAERIGQTGSSISHTLFNHDKQKEELSLPDHRSAMIALCNRLQDTPRLLDNIAGVGHRIVHGGEWYRNPTLITDEVIDRIKEAAKFAPLHSLPNIIGIEVMREKLPSCSHVAVFDTGAYAQMPPKAFLYGIPVNYYKEHHLRKYGFHGINHLYVAEEAAKILNRPLETLKIISCHLGNGSSITAFEKGSAIDNSMGLTPLEGLVMGTRSGDLDPSLLLYLIDELKMSTKQITDLLNKQSGLLGLCGKSDMRDIIHKAQEGDEDCQLAIDIFVSRAQKYIGGYIAALNGLDLLIFTAGIGENSPYIRSRITSNFSYIGAQVDKSANEKNSPIFSAQDSRILLMNIPANEEKVIAQETRRLIP
jgi:acetate kinase